MIRVKSKNNNYQCYVDSYEDIVIDTTLDKGGTGKGIRPHQLLEAAFASCMNISLRMKAKEYGIELNRVETSVRLARGIEEKSIFEYEYKIREPLEEEVRNKITDIVKNCAVRKTLLKQIEFKEIDKDNY